MNTFNRDQQRTLRGALEHIDDLLREAAAIAAGETDTALPRHRTDLTPPWRAQLLTRIAALRQAIPRTAERLELPAREPALPASRAIQALLLYAKLALDEVNAARLRGFGELSPAATQRLEEALRELRRQLAETAAELALRLETPQPPPAGDDSPPTRRAARRTTAKR